MNTRRPLRSVLFRLGIPVGCVLAPLAGCGLTVETPAPVSPGTGHAVDAVLGGLADPDFSHELLVLGTPHLARLGDRLGPGHLESLLSSLETFSSTEIAVESLTPDEIAVLAEHESHDPAAAELLDMFGRRTLSLGRTMQEALGVHRVAATLRATSILENREEELTNEARAELVALFLAAYEYDSATLQWSYLPEEYRARTTLLPEEVRVSLNRRLGTSNEIVTVALPLARRLNLQRLRPVDSQYDGVRTLSAPRDALEAVYSDPAAGRWRQWREEAIGEDPLEAALGAGDLLPYYHTVNSVPYQEVDAAQWAWLFETRHPSGVDRLRYTMWELRNQRTVANLLDVMASTDRERILLIVGASHKAYLDRYLAPLLSVRLVQLEDLQAPTDGGNDRDR